MEAETQVPRRSAKLYEKLIRLYPPSYLSKHRQELRQNFEDLERDIHSRNFFWAFIISDLIKSLSQEYMEYIKKHHWAQFAVALFVFLTLAGGLFTWQVMHLQKAHSTFDNYAAFRGCTHITSRTDTAGTCLTASGASVTIVKFDNRWFLQGDLPVCMIQLGSHCLINQP